MEMTKGTILTGESYGKRVTVESVAADLDLSEIFEMFRTVLVGLSWTETQIDNWILDKAEELKRNRDEDTDQI
jgi:coproporphyrinogen III oxidase-like Fe-S oxidoreductase